MVETGTVGVEHQRHEFVIAAGVGLKLMSAGVMSINGSTTIIGTINLHEMHY